MIRIFKNPQELSKAAAEIFVQEAQKAISKTGRFTVALTGGSSPAQLYQILSAAPYKAEIDWEKVWVFWGDERWFPLDHERSNAKMTLEALLNHVPVPQKNIFSMWEEGWQPEEFASHYEHQLKEVLGNDGLDLVLLGMGSDGHTASLFPGTEVLGEKTKWVEAYFLEAQNEYRVTLTAPFINKAKKVVFIAFGENKADALYEVLKGERNPAMFPSQLIQQTPGEVLWLVDENAAKRLVI